MISKKTIDEIFLSAKIEEVVSDFVPLKKRGSNWVGVCPFHDDKNPSMYVSPRLGIFKCFVCGAGGNATHFLMEHEKISYPEALRYLAAKYNIEIEEDHKEQSAEEIAAQSDREAMFNVNTYAEKYFIQQMNETEEGRNLGLTYFQERGFREATIKKFKLGYCPDGWDKFTQEALKNGYKLEYLLKTGLTKQSENGKNFDFYRGRVIFPIHNAIGKTVGFGGRVLKKQEKIAKYFNSPESEIYHKSDILYGFFFAKKSIRAHDNVYLVEGYTDVISMSEAGIENVVASSGTALTQGQIRLISSQTKNITVLYDGDNAGIKASLRGINLLIEAGLNVKVVLLPDGEDPDSFAQSHRDSELLAYLEQHAENFITFKAGILSKDAGNDPVKRSVMINDILQTIADVKDEIARALYIKECAQRFELSEEMLNAELRKIVWKKINDKRNVERLQTETEQPAELPNIQTPRHIREELKSAEDGIEIAEYKIVKLLLNHGCYEVFVKNDGEDVARQRIDQWVFDELQKEEISLNTPLYEQFYEEYALVASQGFSQEEIRQHFAHTSDPEMQKILLPILFEEEPEYSQQWAKRFDVSTNYTKNNIESLNTEVENCINGLKYRLLEKKTECLNRHLACGPAADKERDILHSLVEIGAKRCELGTLLGIVIPK